MSGKLVLIHFQLHCVDIPIEASSASATSSATSSSLPAAASIALDVIIVDADSKDPSLGMSAPPAAFVSIESLVCMRSLLRPGGLLLVNVVARSDSAMEALKKLFLQVFVDVGEEKNPPEDQRVLERGQVFSLRPSEDEINVLLIGRKGGAPSLVDCGLGTVAVTDAIHRERYIDRWMQVMEDRK